MISIHIENIILFKQAICQVTKKHQFAFGKHLTFKKIYFEFFLQSILQKIYFQIPQKDL